MHIVVIGAGYVGLVTGVSLARNTSHRVTVVEKAPARLNELRHGVMPITEPGLTEAFLESDGRLALAASLDEVEPPDLVFVTVATPISDVGEPDTSQLDSAMADLRAWPTSHVSIRSTLPPGMSLELPARLGRIDGSRMSTNPEFLRQGSAMQDFARPSRIVIGRYPETSADHLSRLACAFERFDGPRLFVDVVTAELIKNVSNGFLALKLSFVNEIAGLAEEFGVDVDEVLRGIALDPRIGSAYMRPGLGFGGSCLPKELQVLTAAGRHRGLPMHIATAVAQVNVEQQDRFIGRIVEELPAGAARVGLLGLSFKSGTDDLRGSPAVYVARRLLRAGYVVSAFDPAVRRDLAEDAAPGIQLTGSAEEVFDGAAAVVVATEWPQFAQIDLPAMRARVARALIFDGRGIIDPALAVQAGFSYRGVGRPPRDPAIPS